MCKAAIHRNNLSLLFRVPALIGVIAWILAAQGSAASQGAESVQELTGQINAGGFVVYRLSNLRAGDRLYVYLEATAGNLDPLAALLDAQVGPKEMEAFQKEVEQALAGQGDPRQAINDIRDRYTLIWDDDSGRGYAAAFEYSIPQDGDYLLLLSGAFSAAGRLTSGGYRLLAGVNAPQVLSGEAALAGQPFAGLDLEAFPAGVRVEEASGSVTAVEPSKTAWLQSIRPGERLFVYVESTSGDARPLVALRDFGGKPVTVANFSGQDSVATLQADFPEGGENYRLEIRMLDAAGNETTGDYRLLVGVNAPEVLSGTARSTSEPVLRQPITVQIGIKLQQIFQVNQQDEFFSAVASLQMEWTDPNLAFSPDSCECASKTYTEKEFDRFLADTRGRWPDFTLYNQQGNRWTQNRVVVVEPNGHATYFERFSTNLQVDFDFRKYPFDTQQFNIRVDMIYPEDSYRFADLPGYSEISPEHGEDEFVISGFTTAVTSEQVSTQAVTSRFTFLFEAPRHLEYYLFRIFVPIILIILVSWVTFFLKDYGRRIEVSTGNLLLFIAFSFSLADNYPRLGYLTFLDAIMAITFIINALVVVYNVYLRRLEMNGQGAEAERIDNILDYLYPVIWMAALAVIIVIFF